MTREEKESLNALIAEFMGMEYLSEYDEWILPTNNEDGLAYKVKYKKLKYHASFDWLVPVYNRILQILMSETNIRKRLDDKSAYVVKFGILNPLVPFENKVSVSSFYLKITDFIKWYNKLLASA